MDVEMSTIKQEQTTYLNENHLNSLGNKVSESSLNNQLNTSNNNNSTINNINNNNNNNNNNNQNNLTNIQNQQFLEEPISNVIHPLALQSPLPQLTDMQCNLILTYLRTFFLFIIFWFC
jgi:hypothetical protein